jgi:hypothetical protein
MRVPETNRDDAQTLALSALGWILIDDTRAQRLLALTGIEPSDLRSRLSDPGVLGAVLGFLEAHQPDLIACADAIGTNPERLVAARESLNG